MGKEKKSSAAVCKGGRRLACAILLTFGLGCSQQDADCLARIGRKGLARAKDSTQGAGDRLSPPWLTLPSAGVELSAVEKVKRRLKWDDQLADANITVTLKKDKIELAGTVSDIHKKQRAEELARTTIGVHSVENRLEIDATAAGKDP